MSATDDSPIDKLATSPATAGNGSAPVAAALERRWLVFAIVSIGLFMASIDQTIVATALPSIEHDLHSGINWSGWTITIYALGQVIAMPMAGKISDMYGRKKVFLVSAAVFTTASLCCGFAGSMPLLLLARLIQALGGGAFMPSATGIVSDHFGEERDRAVGVVLDNGEAVRARYVASSVNPKLLYTRLLPAEALPSEFLARIRNWRNGSGTFRINVALAALPSLAPCLYVAYRLTWGFVGQRHVQDPPMLALVVVVAMVAAVVAIGASIVLDDFGTGYSSLGYLQMFPFDKIKIDRSFVQELASRSDCAAIVCAITGLARSLNIVTTAEGVETEEQYSLVRAAGCNHVQGYLFGKPGPAKALPWKAVLTRTA